MDDPEHARAYANADFSEPHQAFIERFSRCFPDHRPQRVLDLGCGAADIMIRFARAFPGCVLHGVDGAPAMLSLARAALAQAKLEDRIFLIEARLPEDRLPRRAFDTLLSNSLLHHLSDPLVLWRAVSCYAAPNAALFVMDLRRPDTREQAERLVDEYAGDEPEILQRDFLQSLYAAYRPEEVSAQLERADINGFHVAPVGDRHLLVYGRF